LLTPTTAGNILPPRHRRRGSAGARNIGWALAGLVEVAKKRGDAKAEQSARAAFERAWFGAKGGPTSAGCNRRTRAAACWRRRFPAIDSEAGLGDDRKCATDDRDRLSHAS
jgi:hypothetical protein